MRDDAAAFRSSSWRSPPAAHAIVVVGSPTVIGLARDPASVALGSYLVAGGVAGIDSILATAPRLISASPAGADQSAVGLWLLTVVLFGSVLFAGALLLLDRRHGWRVAAAATLVQVFMISTARGGFVFSAGLYGGPLFDQGALTLIYGWAVRAELAIEGSRFFVGLNVVPVVLFGVAFHLRRPPPETVPMHELEELRGAAGDGSENASRGFRFPGRRER